MVVGSKFDYWATVLVDGTFPTHDYCLLSRQNVVCSRLLRTSIFASSFGAQLKRRRRLIGARPLALERFIISCGLLILDLFLIWNEPQFNLQDRTVFLRVFLFYFRVKIFALLYLSISKREEFQRCSIETVQVHLEWAYPFRIAAGEPAFLIKDVHCFFFSLSEWNLKICYKQTIVTPSV